MPIYILKTAANREEQVAYFIKGNANRKGLGVWSIIHPHGMKSYILIEAENRLEAEAAAAGIPYAGKLLPKEVRIEEIEHMLELVKKEIDIKKGDIVEVISGPFKGEQARVMRIDKVKEEAVIELLGAAVPMPTTLRLDAIKLVRRAE